MFECFDAPLRSPREVQIERPYCRYMFSRSVGRRMSGRRYGAVHGVSAYIFHGFDFIGTGRNRAVLDTQPKFGGDFSDHFQSDKGGTSSDPPVDAAAYDADEISVEDLSITDLDVTDLDANHPATSGRVPRCQEHGSARSACRVRLDHRDHQRCRDPRPGRVGVHHGPGG